MKNISKITRLLSSNTRLINRDHHGFLGISMIPTNHTGILQTFKEYSKTLNPGLNFYVPLIQKISLVNNSINQKTIQINVKTEDHSYCNIDVVYNLQIIKENSYYAFFNFDDVEDQVNNLIENELIKETVKYTYNEIYDNKLVIINNVEVNIKRNSGFLMNIVDISHIYLLNITR